MYHTHGGSCLLHQQLPHQTLLRWHCLPQPLASSPPNTTFELSAIQVSHSLQLSPLHLCTVGGGSLDVTEVVGVALCRHPWALGCPAFSQMAGRLGSTWKSQRGPVDSSAFCGGDPGSCLAEQGDVGGGMWGEPQAGACVVGVPLPHS